MGGRNITGLHCICISKVTKFKANNNRGDGDSSLPRTVFA